MRLKALSLAADFLLLPVKMGEKHPVEIPLRVEVHPFFSMGFA